MSFSGLFKAEPSVDDINKAQQRLKNGDLEFRISKWKYGLLFIVSTLVFFSMISANPIHYELGNKQINSLVFLSLSGFFAFLISSNGPRLMLDESGFTIRQMFKTRRIEWNEIDDIKAMSMRNAKFISWKQARDPKVSKPSPWYEKFLGYSSTFQADFNIPLRELLALMRLMKDRASLGRAYNQRQNFAFNPVLNQQAKFGRRGL